MRASSDRPRMAGSPIHFGATDDGIGRVVATCGLVVGESTDGAGDDAVAMTKTTGKDLLPRD